jgi:hypothetical protein
VEWWLGVRERFFLYFDWEMMTYWAIIAASHAFDYYRESQDRALTTAQLQTRLAEARLQALQRQLHPHFLFNTLHSISALMHRDIEAADDMLARLERSAAADARPRRHAARAAQGRARFHQQVPRHRTHRATASGCFELRDRARTR